MGLNKTELKNLRIEYLRGKNITLIYDNLIYYFIRTAHTSNREIDYTISVRPAARVAGGSETITPNFVGQDVKELEGHEYLKDTYDIEIIAFYSLIPRNNDDEL